MQLSHTLPVVSASFDEPNLVSSAGLVPLMRLAEQAGLGRLGDERLTVPTDKGANAGRKLASLVAGMAASADSIDDMALLRHGAMGKIFHRPYAPSTLGSFLRAFTFGHVRQADAIASRFLLALAEGTELLGREDDSGTVMVDIDDTIVEVHGHHKQGASFGYSGVRGLNALLATVSTEQIAPVVAAQRLRKGSAGSPRGAVRLAADTLALIRRTCLAGRPVLVRADSAFYSHALVTAALKTGAHVSVTVRMDPAVKRAIAAISDDAWTTIKYTDAIYDEEAGQWVSRAEVAEIPFTAFTSKKADEQIPGRLVVRRIPDLNPKKNHGQATLFDTWRFHAFFTTVPRAERDTVAADKVHRAHAIIENVHADLKASALAHMPSGVFNANAAWLVCAVMAFNLTRAAATLTKTRPCRGRPRQRSAASSSTCPPALPAPLGVSVSTCPRAGHGRGPGPRSTTPSFRVGRPRRSDHQTQSLRAGIPVERPGRPAAPTRPRPSPDLLAPSATSSAAHRWIEAKQCLPLSVHAPMDGVAAVNWWRHMTTTRSPGRRHPTCGCQQGASLTTPTERGGSGPSTLRVGE